MRKISVISMVTLDGVMQAPGDPGEDTEGNFKFGGWMAAFMDEVGGKVTQKQMEPKDYLLGRKTFDIFASYWPKHADDWPGINEGTKYVLSKTQKKSSWKNTVFLESLAEIKKLKSQDGPQLQVWGSSELVHLLFHNDLVDELCLKIFPVILGQGKKIFGTLAIPLAFTMVDSVVTTTGGIIATYKRSGEVKTGTVGD